jgi:hypothetical protein
MRGVARALRTHEHRTAAGCFALLVLAYLWPALLGGKALTGTPLLYESAPWSGIAPEGVQRLVNPQLGDAVYLYYPWDVLARRLLHAGVFPAWNPYALGGTPFFANFQVAWASPFSLPLWLLPLDRGLGVAAALKLWLAGFGTYLLVRELRLGFWPALLAGTSFALCAFDVVWLAHGVFVSAAAMLPWGLWLVERLLTRGRQRDALALVAVVGVLMTAGHPGTQLHVLTAIALFALVRTALARGPSRRERLRRLGLAGAGIALGSLLSAVVLLPAQLAAHDTVGVWNRLHRPELFPGARMRLGVLRTALFPDWWGRPESTQLLESAPANFRERTFYAGVAPLVLAFAALVGPGAWRRKAPFAAIALLGAAIATHTPLQTLVMHLPLFDGVQNQRILLWVVFAVPVLAAFGLDAVLRGGTSRRTWAVLAATLLVALLAVRGLDTEATVRSEAVHYFLNRGGGSLPAAVALGSVAWAVVLVLALAATLAAIGRWRGAAALLVLVVALDLLHFAHGYQKMVPGSQVVPPATPAIVYLQRHAGDGRIAGLGQTLPDDFGIVYGLRDARGVDVPQPTLTFDALWRQASPQDDYSQLSQVTHRTVQVLGVLGARYLLAPPQATLAGRGLAAVYRGEDATVYADTLALPRALVVEDVLARGDLAGAQTIASAGFDTRRRAVVAVAGDRRLTLPQPGARGSATVVGEHNGDVTIRATLSKRGLVVLDDAWAPGWKVTVDGRPAPALRTDVVLRGVLVPAGRHTIAWSYTVPGLAAGAALSALGAAIALAWASWLLVRRRRRRRAREAPTR